MVRSVKRKYSNGEVTVVWQSGLCKHSGICFRGLPDVFNPFIVPWVNLDAATTDEIVSQVKKCPSGALSFYYNNETNSDHE